MTIPANNARVFVGESFGNIRAKPRRTNSMMIRGIIS
jgi:hypothetical protein